MPVSIPGKTNAYFVQYSDGGRDEPWELLVESSITAAQILRCSWGLTILDVLDELVNRGIPFKMLLAAKFQRYSPFAPHPALLLPVLNGIGEREPGFKASATEYSAYEDLRKAFLLRYPHCQSAFTRGGILWRLCYDDLSQSQLDHGPCGLPPNQRQVSCNGLEYYEDYLTPDEEDLVVGVYKVRNCEYIMCHVYRCDLTPSAVTTGAASYQDYSWWPKQSTWEASGLNVGYWSSGAEDWYKRRLHAIRNNVQPPYNASKWASNLKFLKGDLAKITHTLEDLTSSRLDNIV